MILQVKATIALPRSFTVGSRLCWAGRDCAAPFISELCVLCCPLSYLRKVFRLIAPQVPCVSSKTAAICSSGAFMSPHTCPPTTAMVGPKPRLSSNGYAIVNCNVCVLTRKRKSDAKSGSRSKNPGVSGFALPRADIAMAKADEVVDSMDIVDLPYYKRRGAR